jgi:hypothetical protein
MRALFIAAAAVQSIAVRPAQAQAIPDLNVDPYVMGSRSRRQIRPRRARRILLSRNALKANGCGKKLVNEWSTFLPTEKTNCIGEQMGGMASYTDLVSCLEMAKDARQLNQGK